ncbi:hypothetical protein LINGRAHAP2_LOCUS27910 [Linum grandiflorum]
MSPQLFLIVASFTNHQVVPSSLQYRASRLLILLSSIVVDFEAPSTVRPPIQIRVSICGRLSFLYLRLQFTDHQMVGYGNPNAIHVGGDDSKFKIFNNNVEKMI